MATIAIVSFRKIILYNKQYLRQRHLKAIVSFRKIILYNTKAQTLDKARALV